MNGNEGLAMKTLDRIAQPLKDVREAFTLTSKWKNLSPHVPSWMKHVDFSAQKGCLLDVGCHYGIVSMEYIRQTGQPAYGFDVNPHINALLKANLPQHAGGKSFTLMGFGLSDQEGMVTSYSDTRYSGATTVQPDQVSVAKSLLDLDLRPRVSVPVKRMDDLTFPERVAYIKIDCEGHEDAVLRGGLATIQKNAPIILFEALTPKKREACTKILTSISYTVEPLDARNFIARKEGSK